MKTSIYNLFIPSSSSNDKYILYNFLHDSCIIVDEELKCIIENNKFDNIENEKIKMELEKQGIFVEESVDERKIFLYYYLKEKFKSDYSLFVVLTTFACNLSCHYCYEGAGKFLSKTMDENTTNKVIDFIKRKSLEDNTKKIMIKLYGGEPLLNPQSCKMLLSNLHIWGQKNSISVNSLLQTNGTLVNESLINYLSGCLTAVEITLDGPPERHNNYRVYKNGGGTYEDIIKNIMSLVDSRITVVLRLNVFNPQELEFLLDDLTIRGLRESPYIFFYIAAIYDHNFLEASTYDNNFMELFSSDNICVSEEDKSLELIPYMHEVIEKKGWWDRYQDYGPVNKRRLVFCNNEKCGRYIIDPFGDFYRCIYFAGHREYKVGTINDINSESNLANYEILTRNPLKLMECYNCVYLPACGGGCPVKASINNKTYKSSYCGSMKKLISKRIILHLKDKYPDRFEEGKL